MLRHGVSEGLLLLEFNVGEGSVPFRVFKELSMSGAISDSPMLGGPFSFVCCVAMAASLSLADRPDNCAFKACSREYCCRWASLDSSKAN